MAAATATVAEAVETIEAAELTDLQAGQALPSVRRQLDAAYGRARMMHQAPFKMFDFKHRQFIDNCARKSPREQHAVLIEAVAYFERMVADPTAWPGTKFAEDQAHAETTAQIGARQLRSMGLAFNPHGFVASLRGRGLGVALGADGRISIAPASLLKPTDREQLRGHRTEIVVALTDVEAF